jgi:hypothetical protein
MTNRTALDEATRSVRRTFIASTLGSLSMLGVVGAAGAYGLPESLNEKSLTAALLSLRTTVTPMVERATPIIARAMQIANEQMAPATASVVVPVPPRAEATAPPIAAASPVATVAADAPAMFELASVDPAQPAAIFKLPPVTAPAIADAPKAPALPQIAEAPKEIPKPAGTSRPAEPPKTAEAPAPAAAPEPPLVAAQAAQPVAAAQTAAKAEAAAAPETITNSVDAPRIVTVELPRPKPPLTPAQRLGLHGNDYDKAERCLAKAVYFEARNQPVRGQMAVAQVVMNRVFSPYYPNDVCGVVYQNAHRYLSCQFTFACDGKSEAVRERGAWARAQRIAQQTLTAEIWLPEVAKATHYHAAYVRPYWVREMNVMVRFGLHTFYRPRQWGDGSNEPAWGDGAAAGKKGRSS